MNHYMNKHILRHLFNNSLYLDVIQINVRRSERISNIEKKDYNLSPQSRELLSYFSPETQKRLARDFYLDELAINKYLEKQEIDDPNYIYFNASGVGTYLELWVCVNILCPGCGHKLYKYANPNMPVVDVRCINTGHVNGPIYYQIKATQQGAVHAGYKYFSYDDNYVSAGSINYGYNCHIIRADDYNSRDILVGYICIEYNYTDPTFNKIIIDMNSSFILIPNLQFQPNIYQKDSTYYQYLRTTPSAIIGFNNIMVNKYRFSELYQPFGIILLSNYYDVVKVYNEEPPLFNMQYKYLIMKKKYLDLKNKIN